MSTPYRIRDAVSAAAATAAHLRLIPVDLARPAPETLDYLPRCSRCGTARQDLTRLDGQLVCADRVDCYQAWLR